MKDRMDESKAIKKKKNKNGKYKLVDMNATANLPQDVVHMYYKSDDYGMYRDYDDSSAGMEDQANGDRKMAVKSKPKSRY